MTLGDYLRKRIQPKPPWVRRPEILLAPNIPKPLHGVAPRVILGAKWWDETRKAAYRSTSYHCLACGVWKMVAQFRQWLEGHELYSVDYRRGRMTYLETVPLCHCCHNYIHDGRMIALVDQGKMTHAKYAAIIQHGDQILAQAGLARVTRMDRDETLRQAILSDEVAPWEKWRLVLGGKLYPPLYKDPAEWEAAHNDC